MQLPIFCGGSTQMPCCMHANPASHSHTSPVLHSVYSKCAPLTNHTPFPLQVHYEGVRRFKLLAVDKEREPYYMAAVQW